jgi:hypothetical protein
MRYYLNVVGIPACAGHLDRSAGGEVNFLLRHSRLTNGSRPLEWGLDVGPIGLRKMY